VSNRELPVPPGHGTGGSKRLRRFVSLVTATALSVSLTAGAAAAQAARTASVSSTASHSALPAGSSASDGRSTLDLDQAGFSSQQVLSAVRALVAVRGRILDHETATAESTRPGAAVDVAADNAGDSIITIVPGVTLTITSGGVQLSLSSQVVDNIQAGLESGQEIADFVAGVVGDALDAAGVPLGDWIAEGVGIAVASTLAAGAYLLHLCTAEDGSANFTILWSGPPSCGSPSLTA
jgi:hypothetical protein